MAASSHLGASRIHRGIRLPVKDASSLLGRAFFPCHHQRIIRSRHEFRVLCKKVESEAEIVETKFVGKPELLENGRKIPTSFEEMDCVGTGTDVECVYRDLESDFRFGGTVSSRAIDSSDPASSSKAFSSAEKRMDQTGSSGALDTALLDNLLLISPFFFWGTAMVAMKGVLPKAGPYFVASTRLVPAGLLLVGFASLRGRKQPSGLYAWLSILIFSIVDASCFQGFLAAGLGKTSAGLGSVIIDSQPLTVAILASILFNETIKPLGVLGLLLGVAGLLLLEVITSFIVLASSHWNLPQVPAESLGALLSSGGGIEFSSSFWSSGEWYMLLAAQSMALGTLLVRWVCKFSDPIMATGWHMIIGGLPLLLLAASNNEPALNGHLEDLMVSDWASLAYTSIFGSAISYGVFFYNATKGSLTKLSSLTFLTPMFAAFFGYLVLDESLNGAQILGATITLAGIYLVNARPP
ncbi:WAT1-related protein At3g02690, chloroplastic isoform X2 [Selaginella moellendorffii]|nr:WAT1-related protein At3g02690, chloroplastic isoform X2 [Selaginella moellendorffii]|eukprot:XP_024542555.1 WAT1-related protein At3g02690, chloroplastic isoform X2 [Selaginella moellendorffii]